MPPSESALSHTKRISTTYGAIKLKSNGGGSFAWATASRKRPLDRRNDPKNEKKGQIAVPGEMDIFSKKSPFSVNFQNFEKPFGIDLENLCALLDHQYEHTATAIHEDDFIFILKLTPRF